MRREFLATYNFFDEQLLRNFMKDRFELYGNYGLWWFDLSQN
jgi:hypothetical protein